MDIEFQNFLQLYLSIDVRGGYLSTVDFYKVQDPRKVPLFLKNLNASIPVNKLIKLNFAAIERVN